MKRLKSSLATIMLVAAGAAAIGLGTVMAVAALVIGLVVAGAARLAVGAEPQASRQGEPADTGVVEGQLATAG